jgi:glycosyltransferase involved in cell wall biosynthesis
MRICIDASNLSRGGGLTHLVELLRQDLPALGVGQVFVWSSRATLSAIEDRPWITRRHDPALERGFLPRALWQRRRLGALARADGCDLLFAPGGSFATAFRPVVTMSRNMLPFERAERQRYGLSPMALRLWILRWTQARSYRAADGTIFLTRYARDAVTAQTGALPGLTALVPHGVDARFRGAPHRARPLEACSEEAPFRIVYVSIVDHYKHQDQVARAVVALRDKGLPVRLELIGPAYLPALARLEYVLDELDPQRRTVRVCGPMRYDELPAVYAGADLAVFASSCENMPNILLEMMSSGVPIACSDRGPMPEVLGEGETFDPERPDQIAQAIERLMRSPALREQHAAMAAARAAGFSWRRCAQETCAFLAAVVAHSRGAAAAAGPAGSTPHSG